VIPATVTLLNIVVAGGETNCYNALQTIYVSGTGDTFTVQAGGSATMITGQNIVYLPGTTLDSGGYMHGYITITGNYCTNPSNPVVNNPVQFEELTAFVPEILRTGKGGLDPGIYFIHVTMASSLGTVKLIKL